MINDPSITFEFQNKAKKYKNKIVIVPFCVPISSPVFQINIQAKISPASVVFGLKTL